MPFTLKKSTYCPFSEQQTNYDSLSLIVITDSLSTDHGPLTISWIHLFAPQLGWGWTHWMGMGWTRWME